MPGAPQLNVTPVEVVGQQLIQGHAFPLVLQCDTAETTLQATCHWISSRREELLAKMSEHGAVLFRGFPLSTPDDFDAFITAFDLPNFPYNRSLSNAVRVNWTDRVFSANEAPPEVRIFLHHEMAQTPLYPAKIFFFCVQPAESGGETPLCRSDVLFEQLTRHCPGFARKCEQEGLQYTNVMPSEDDPESGMGRSWQSTLGAQTREQAEERLRELDYTWEWLPDGCLRATTPVLPAVREVSPGRKAFFNQLIAAFQGWKDSRNDPAKAIRFGSGDPMDRPAVDKATELAGELSFHLAWQQGDTVLVDNQLVMHARSPFQGKRKVLASLAEMQTHGPARDTGSNSTVARPHFKPHDARATQS